MTYQSTDIVKENIYEVPSAIPSPLKNGCFVTQGGTKTDAGTLTSGLRSVAEIDNLLHDSNPITALAHHWHEFSQLIGVNAAISAAVQHHVAITSMAWVAGTVTATKVAHGLPVGETIELLIAGCTPTGYNGTRICTIADVDTFTFLSDDHGSLTVQGTANCIALTATAHGLPLNSIIGASLSGITPSSLSGLQSLSVTDANTIYYPVAYTATTITVVNASLQTAKAIITAHGLPLNVPFYAEITGASLASYNGVKRIYASGTGTIYYGVESSSNTPSYAQAHLSVVIGASTDALGYELNTQQNLTISGCVPTGFNGAYSCDVIDTDAFSYIPVTTRWLGVATTLGKVLNTAASQLHAAAKSFYSHDTSLTVSILELGSGTVAAGVAALADYVALDQHAQHAYTLPRDWDVQAMADLCFQYAPIANFPLFIIPTKLANFGLFYGMLDVVCVLESNSAKRPIDEYSAGELMGQYLDNEPTVSVPMAQFQYRYSNSTPYIFSSINDPLITTLRAQNATYVADCAEAGITGQMWVGAMLMGSDYATKPVDIMAKWAVNYIAVGIDRTMAKAIIDSSNGAGFRLNLNDSQGQMCVDTIRTIAQGFCDGASGAGIIEKNKVIAQPYFEWKSGHSADYAAKNYTGLTVPVSARFGITNLKITIPVSFV